MDYEKEYKEALERARAGKPIDEVFPELRESEDERILEAMIFRLGELSEMWFENIFCKQFTKAQIFAYLERQKEQKAIQSRNEKEYVRILKSIIADFIRDKKPEDVSFYQKIYDWLDGRHIEQKPAEWSEKDEINMDYVLHIISELSINEWPNRDGLFDWLKGLSNRFKLSHWKPSEEQN